MLKQNKKIYVGLFAFVLALSTAWFCAFEYVKGKIREDFEHAVTHLKSRGYDISYAALSFGGHPLLVNATVQNLKVITPHKWGGGEAEILIISARPWACWHLFLEFRGKTLFDAPSYLNHPFLKVGCENCQAEVWLVKSDWQEIQITSRQVGFEDGTVNLPLTLTDLRLDLKQDQRLHVNLATKIQGVDQILNLKGYDQPIDLILETETSHLDSAEASKSLMAWRDAGGALDVTKLLLKWKPLEIKGNGAFTFDEVMRPLSAFSATITGYDKLLEILTQTGAIKKKTAQIANFALGLLAQKGPQGEMEITVPVTVQNGKLSVGPADLMNVGAVE